MPLILCELIAFRPASASRQLGLLFVTMLACYVPARRVLRIEPASPLRLD